MKRLVLLVLTVAVMATIGVPAAAQDKQAHNLTGKWTLKMTEGPHGPQEWPLVLKQDGSKVHAVVTPTGHGIDIELTGEFVKGELTLSVPASDKNMAIRMKATLKSDGSLAGFTSSDMGDTTWTAARVK